MPYVAMNSSLQLVDVVVDEDVSCHRCEQSTPDPEVLSCDLVEGSLRLLEDAVEISVVLHEGVDVHGGDDDQALNVGCQLKELVHLLGEGFCLSSRAAVSSFGDGETQSV